MRADLSVMAFPECDAVSSMSVTFTWPLGTDEAGTILKLSMPVSALAARDPEGKTLLSAKMSFVGQPEFTLEATGPGEAEYMLPELIKFVWKFVSSGCLEVTEGLECADCERALEYFGFSDRKVVVPDTDPRRIGKQIAYNQHREAMLNSPKIVAYVEKALLKPGVGPAGVIFVVDDTSATHNTFGDVIDLPLESVSNCTGAEVQRFAVVSSCTGAKKMMTLLGGSDKTCTSLRAHVLAQTNALGGVKAEWKTQCLKLRDVGEFGNHDYVIAQRYVLAVHLDRSGEQDCIKRRKID
eukprot:CAMPEP_0119078916 /NCGR_PEP_ID=MMETSP1178-20130426/103711_1 /TAXON_ID=33656 /ORGANISM="unid sp, Strain CCMP2000" /LENGTH=295 /DNA_ID=CAMNT_0007061397 /DNA_START=18 /DNA_END=905 /DNA_ORIENTATION=+